MARVDVAGDICFLQDPRVHVRLRHRMQRRLDPPVPPITDVVPAEADIHRIFLIALSLPPLSV